MKLKYGNIAVITAIVLTLMLFPVSLVYAASEDEDEGYKDGYNSGWTDGMEAAWDDLDEGSRKSYTKSIPSNSEIKEYFELDEESKNYEKGFLSGYKAGFREGYNFGYENPAFGAEAQVAYDEELGYKMGEIKGKIDFYAGRENKWNYTVPTTVSIIQIFELSKESEAYKNDFIANFRTFYRKGYEYGYRSAKFSPMQTDIEQGSKDGEQFGATLGSNNGRLDYYNGFDNQWDRVIPSDNEIEGIFLLTKDTEDYRNAFLSAFKTAYRAKYEEAYRKANADKNTLLFEQGYEQGKSVGVIKGESLAKLDRILNYTNEESRHSYRESDVIKEYMLFNENKSYREGFLSGYRAGRKEGYLITYQQSGYEYGISKIVTELVPISGMDMKSGDGRLKLSIEKGTFYNDIVISIDTTTSSNRTVKLPERNNLIRASELYSVSISNSSAVVNRDKTIKLSIDYYGSEYGGIYMYTAEGWKYMPSKLDAKGLSTRIIPKTTVNSTEIYAVFIDEKARNPQDVRGHWAKDEIVTYLRRGLISTYKDNYFMPDAALTYNQAVKWLNDVYGTELEASTADKPMTYVDFEKIVRKATGDESFSWAFIAEKIARNKDKRSGSYSSMNRYIIRAEAVYMLYYMNE